MMDTHLRETSPFKETWSAREDSPYKEEWVNEKDIEIFNCLNVAEGQKKCLKK